MLPHKLICGFWKFTVDGDWLNATIAPSVEKGLHVWTCIKEIVNPDMTTSAKQQLITKTKSQFDFYSLEQVYFTRMHYKNRERNDCLPWNNRALWNKGRMHQENDKRKAVTFLNPANQGSTRWLRKMKCTQDIEIPHFRMKKSQLNRWMCSAKGILHVWSWWNIRTQVQKYVPSKTIHTTSEVC